MVFTLVERSGECQEKVVLKIDNAAKFLEMSNEELEENGVIFEAGYCTLNDGTEIPATWKYSFQQYFEDRRGYVLGGFLALHRPTNKSDVRSANASYSVSLSSGGNPFASFTSKRKEFAGTSAAEAKRNTIIAEYDLRKEIKGNVLEITLLVKVFSSHSFDPVLKTPPSTISAAELKSQANLDLVKMLESGDWADVKIRVPKEVGGDVDASSYTRKAHKNILTTRSSVFAKMFAEDSTMTEAKTGEVVIKDISPKGLDIFLRYLYTGEVSQDWVPVLPELLNAAEKYDCVELKEYCGGNILAALSTNNALDLYKLTNLHGLTHAAETVLGFISKNTKAVIDKVVQESK